MLHNLGQNILDLRSNFLASHYFSSNDPPPISMLKTLVKGEQLSNKATLNRAGGGGGGEERKPKKEQKHWKFIDIQNILSKIVDCLDHILQRGEGVRQKSPVLTGLISGRTGTYSAPWAHVQVN